MIRCLSILLSTVCVAIVEPVIFDISPRVDLSSVSPTDTHDFYGSQIEAIKQQINWRLEAQEKQSELRFTAMQLALDKASQALDIRLEAMNEFRMQITDERGQYVRVDQLKSELALLDVKVGRNTDLISLLRTDVANASGRSTVWIIVGGACGGLVVSLIVAYATKKLYHSNDDGDLDNDKKE